MPETTEKVGCSKDLPNKSTTQERNEHNGNAQTKLELAIRHEQKNLLEVWKDAIETRFTVKIKMLSSGNGQEQRLHIVGSQQACERASVSFLSCSHLIFRIFSY